MKAVCRFTNFAEMPGVTLAIGSIAALLWRWTRSITNKHIIMVGWYNHPVLSDLFLALPMASMKTQIQQRKSDGLALTFVNCPRKLRNEVIFSKNFQIRNESDNPRPVDGHEVDDGRSV